jgi:hypothetical protein
MRVKVVTLQYSPSLGGFDERPLADFVRDKEILAVREHFFSVHDLPHLACLITYQDPVAVPADRDAPGSGSGHGAGRRRTGERRDRDLAELLAGLSPGDRTLFATLRQWRSARARKDGLPPYVLFTNQELLAIVSAKPRTPGALQALDGIGPAKVERYGRPILEAVNGSARPAGISGPPAASAAEAIPPEASPVEATP